jgi:glutaredoxin-related protein
MNDPKVEEKVKQQFDQVNKLKISGIPAIVVGNRFIMKLVRFPWNDSQSL